ncbi:MAG: transposase, partial [Rickettsiales bacterium]
MKKHLPEDLKKHLDLDHLKVERDTFVSEDLKESMSDIVYKIKTKNQKKDGDVILFLCEHQSSND